MRKLCRVNIERSEEIFEKIEKYKEKVTKELNPKLILIFGSFARGDINEGSDVDILVVADFKESFIDRIKVLMDLNDVGLPLEPVGYRVDEFIKMKEEGNSFIVNVLKEGKILYNDLIKQR